MSFTPLLKAQRDFFSTGATRPAAFRVRALRRLEGVVRRREAEMLAALHSDLRKPAHEAYSAEVAVVLAEIDYAARRVNQWSRPQRRRAPRMAFPARARVVPEPRGIGLILGAWNYPVQLLLVPLVGAVAAGCCAVLKTSEFAPRSGEVIEAIIRDAFPPEHVAVVRGDRSVAAALLEERFDSIFFTGSTRGGRDVMAAAAKHLTPVTLELGGKCPCIVCADAPPDVAARRIVWGKMMNAGQTCVAPDYVLVEASGHDRLVTALRAAIEQFYSADPRNSPDFGRIVNRGHFDRLVGYLPEGRVAAGGEHDAGDLYIAPTLLTHVPDDARVLSDEIFGPILPVVAVDSVDDALARIGRLPAPLSAYLFTGSRRVRERVVRELRCGGMCVNDVAVHLFGKDLPFGGVGDSGIGRYHGKATFEAFTHFKTVVRCRTSPDLAYRYPPPRLPIDRLRRVLGFLLRN